LQIGPESCVAKPVCALRLNVRSLSCDSALGRTGQLLSLQGFGMVRYLVDSHKLPDSVADSPITNPLPGRHEKLATCQGCGTTAASDRYGSLPIPSAGTSHGSRSRNPYAR
jgi:hypothetical protein